MDKKPKKKSTPAGRNAQVERTFHVFFDLEMQGGTTIYELAVRYGVSPRTIEDDLETLRRLGVWLESEWDGKMKRWRIDREHQLHKLRSRFDKRHWLAQRMLMRDLDPSSGLGMLAEQICDWIEESIGEEGRPELHELADCLYLETKFSRLDTPLDIVIPLCQAKTQKRICKVVYDSPYNDAITRFEILPLKLYHHDGAWRVWFKSLKSNNVLPLVINCIKGLTPTDRHAEPPPGWTAEEQAKKGFGGHESGTPVLHRFIVSKRAAKAIQKHRWHPSQKFKKLSGGRVQLTFLVPVSPETEAFAMRHVKVAVAKEPPELIERLNQNWQLMSRQYPTPRKRKLAAKKAGSKTNEPGPSS